MKKRMTKEDARAFRDRWQLVNAFERDELRATPLEVKLRQLAALVASAGPMGWGAARIAEETVVRERWQRLRRFYGV